MPSPVTIASPTALMRAAGVSPASPAIGCVLDAAYGVAPTAEQRKLWPALSQMPWPRRRARRLVACIGRRGLKTSGLLAWSAVYEMLCVPHDEHALAGTRIYAVIVAPRQAQAREAVRAVKAALDQLAPLGVAYTERDAAGTPEIVITRPRGRCERVLSVMTCDAVSVRGFAIYFFGRDESGHWPSESWLSETDRDVVRAIRAGVVQFPDAREVAVGTPGRPGSLFHSEVTKPTAGSLVVSAPTWVTNPRITRERCLADAGGDLATFEQEYEATRWGASGEAFIDSTKVWACLNSPHAGRGPRPGAFVVGFDHGQLQDDAAIVAASCFEVEIAPTTAPVRHVVVEHATAIPSSKTSPLPTAALVARVVAVSESYGRAPILFDAHSAVDTKTELLKRGYREWKEDHPGRLPPPRTFMQVSMAPQHQTPRWIALRDLVHGGRLHLGADDALAQELCGLSATQQSSGQLKVEGRKDNQADALAIAVPIALRLPPTGGTSEGVVRFKFDGVVWDHSGVHARRPRFVRETPDGREVPCEVPRWDPSFPEYAANALASGWTTPSIEAWRAERASK